MSLRDEPHIIVKATLVKPGEKAWLLRFEDLNEQLWIPKSQAEWHRKGEWMLSRWIAEQKGLI